MMHWGHRTLMGAVRGLLAIPIGSWAIATAVFFGLLWVGDVLIYRVLRITDWPWRWERDGLARDIGFQLLYVLATSTAFAALTEAFTSWPLRSPRPSREASSPGSVAPE